MKLEECIRSVNTLLSQGSTISIRGKFSRLREITLVLTSDITTSAAANFDSLVHLTEVEAQAFLSLRCDILP
jgi:hypothetical protein